MKTFAVANRRRMTPQLPQEHPSNFRESSEVFRQASDRAFMHRFSEALAKGLPCLIKAAT